MTTTVHARITPKAQPNGTVTLAESKAYADLSPKDRYIEFVSTNLFMLDTATEHGAPQDVVNDINLLQHQLTASYTMYRHNGDHTFDGLPTFDQFNAVVTKYNAWVNTQTLNLNSTATNPTPASAVNGHPVPPAPSQTEPEAPVADGTPATPATVVETPAENSDTAEILRLLKGEHGILHRTTEHHNVLYGDENGNPGVIARVEALEHGNVLHSDGTSVPWHSRTVNVGSYKLRTGLAALAFFVTFTLLVLFTWASNTDAGILGAFRWWQPIISVAVSIAVLFLTNSNRNTAPAVEREERV